MSETVKYSDHRVIVHEIITKSTFIYFHTKRINLQFPLAKTIITIRSKLIMFEMNYVQIIFVFFKNGLLIAYTSFS